MLGRNGDFKPAHFALFKAVDKPESWYKCGCYAAGISIPVVVTERRRSGVGLVPLPGARCALVMAPRLFDEIGM